MFGVLGLGFRWFRVCRAFRVFWSLGAYGIQGVGFYGLGF